MHEFFLATGLALLAMMALVFFRIVRGPTVLDRVVALNVLGTKTVVLLVIIGALVPSAVAGHGTQLGMFVDFALTYALLNFVGALAAAKLLQRRAASRQPLPRTVARRRAGEVHA